MKKGFTLIELLGVIVVLGIIATITVPLVQRTITEQNEQAYEDQVASFERAAKGYTASDIYNMSCTGVTSEAICSHTVTLKQLQEKGFLESGTIKNSKTGEDFDLENEVDITYENGKFTYKYDTKQDEN